MSGYSFNASALGLGAVLRSGGAKTVIPSLASVSLAPTGGEGSAVHENYDCNGISFTRAESRVFGSEVSDGVYTTSSDVYITNLTIFERLRIALMTATISSTRDLNQDESFFDVQAIYRGIAVDDCEVLAECDIKLCTARKYEHVLDALKEDIDGYAEGWGAPREGLEIVTRDRNPVNPLSGSIVRKLHRPEELAHGRRRHVIRIPGLGLAHFGEFLFKPGRRRVNLLRLKLFGGEAPGGPQAFALMDGSGGDGGDITVGSVEGNGSPPIP